jgi:hypothetical protein
MKAAVGLFPEDIIKLPCAAHRLNLAVKDLLNPKKIGCDSKADISKQTYYIYDYNEDDELRKMPIHVEKIKEIERMNTIKSHINDLVSKCKHLVGSFRFSEQLSRKLKEKQNELKVENPIKLIQDVPTRWNSTFAMLSSIVVNEAPLKVLNLDPENDTIHGYVPTSQEFEFIKELCTLLKPLKDLTKLLSGTNYVTISHLYPAVFCFMRYEYKEMNFLNVQIKELKAELEKILSNRFRYVLNSAFFQAVTFMDPQYKKFEFIKVMINYFPS